MLGLSASWIGGSVGIEPPKALSMFISDSEEGKLGDVRQHESGHSIMKRLIRANQCVCACVWFECNMFGKSHGHLIDHPSIHSMVHYGTLPDAVSLQESGACGLRYRSGAAIQWNRYDVQSYCVLI